MGDRESKLRRDAIRRRKKTAWLRTVIIDALGAKCSRCGFDDARAICIDHKNGGGTKERDQIGGGYYYVVMQRIRDGFDGYQLLCANCNQIKKVEAGEERCRVHAD